MDTTNDYNWFPHHCSERNILIFTLFFRLKRSEIKIQAWENLEKAKAEADMRKTEVRLMLVTPT